MGSSFSFLKEWWYGAAPLRILILGLDDAGKTSILYRLKLGEQIRTVSTIGFNVETISVQNVRLTIWDTGGGDKLRRLIYTHYTQDTQAIIWVIDSTDKDRFAEAKEELLHVLSLDDVKGVRLLVFNTKSDMENAVPSSEIADHLGLKILEREWCIMKCSSKTGDGLWDGMEKLRLSLTGEKPMDGEIC